MGAFVAEFSAEAIKLGPPPEQFKAKAKPESTVVVEASSKPQQEKQRAELEAKRGKVKVLKDRLSERESRLNAQIARLTALTREAEDLKQRIEGKKENFALIRNYLYEKGGTPNAHKDYIEELKGQMRDKDAAIRSFAQQGGKDAEAKIAKVLEAKKKIQERIDDTEKKHKRENADVERVMARKGDVESEINALKQELALVEAEIPGVAETARKMSVEKKMVELEIEEAEKEMREIEAYFGWIESRHVPKIEIKTQADPDMIISHAEQMRLRRITRLAEIEKEIEEMEKESGGKG